MDKKIEHRLTDVINTIFKDKNLVEMPKQEKRQEIFSYLCDNLTYDLGLLEKIVENEVGKTRNRRDPVEELHDAVFNNHGICSSISQFYKLLLEQVGVKSYCVVCDNGMEVPHQLSLVYDDESKTYSFDDITSVIVKLGSKQDFFGYDVETARLKNQGNKPVLDGDNYIVLPEDYIDFLVNREKSTYQTITSLPANIQKVQNTILEPLPCQ